VKVLGIETATEFASVAVVEKGEVYVEALARLHRRLTEELVLLIRWALERAGMEPRELDGVAVSIGPGSFTGLRVGVATAKGLCFACGLPLAAVPTLKAMAARMAHSPFPICPLLDARRKEVYAALYRWEEDGLTEALPPQAFKLEELLTSLEGPVLFTGDAVGVFKEAIRERLGNGALFAPPELSRPHAASVARMGEEALAQGDVSDLSSLEPLYIRSPDVKHIRPSKPPCPRSSKSTPPTT